MNVSDLPGSDRARLLEGKTIGAGISMFIINAPPGHGPGMHHHPYEEVFVVHSGTGVWVADGVEIEGGPGSIIRVPPDTPHKFTAVEQLSATSVHNSPELIQFELE